MSNPPASLRRRALRSATWAMFGANLSQMLALFMFLITSRLVGPEAFGIVAVALGIVELGRVVVVENVASNLVARGRAEKALFNTGLALALTGAIVITASLWIAAPHLARLFRTPALASALPPIALLLAPLTIVRLQEAFLAIELQFRPIALRSIFATLAGGSVGVAAAIAGMGLNALIIQQWAIVLFSLASLSVACKWRPRIVRPLKSEILAQARSSTVLAPAALMSQMSMVIDGLAVAALLGPYAAGLYNLAKRMRIALHTGFSTAINRTALPTLSKTKGDPKRLEIALEHLLELTALVVAPIFFGAAAIAPEFIGIALGEKWAAAAQPMAILMIAGAVAIITSLCECFLLVVDKRKRILFWRFIMLAALIISIAIVGRHGPSAIAAASLFAVVVHNLGSWSALAEILPHRLHALIKQVAPPFLFATLMFAIITLLRGAQIVEALSAPMRLLLFVALGIAIYVALILTLAPRSARALISAARSAIAPISPRPNRNISPQ